MEISYNPRVSMRVEHRYTTQSAIWDCHVTENLTDKKIHQYALAGRYGAEIQAKARAEDALESQAKRKKTDKYKKFEAMLDVLLDR